MPLFGRKKKLVISEPSGGHLNTRFELVHGAWATMPLLHQWLSASRGSGGNPPREAVLIQMDNYLAGYHRQRDWWAKLSLLGQLYFLSSYWLKKAKANQNPLSEARQPAVNDLYRVVVHTLCEKLNCHVNVLPEMIERYWGRVLTPHGFTEDHRKPYTNDQLPPGSSPQITTYLTRAELEKYHLAFFDGKAYQVPFWNKDGPFDLVPAESAKVGWTEGVPSGQPMMERDFAGFALSMDREFYMARHHGNDWIGNFFHSCYLAGDSVLCTGTLLIRNGRVLEVKNDSGHYRPTIAHLVSVVQTLEMYGTAPHRLLVHAIAGSWFDQRGNPGQLDYTLTGDRLLTLGSTGWDLKDRHDKNRDNISKRGYRTAPPPIR